MNKTLTALVFGAAALVPASIDASVTFPCTREVHEVRIVPFNKRTKTKSDQELKLVDHEGRTYTVTGKVLRKYFIETSCPMYELLGPVYPKIKYVTK